MDRIRTGWEYLKYVGRPEWPIGLAVVGVVLGAVTLLPTAVGLVLSVLGLGLGLVTLAHDLRHFVSRWRTYEIDQVVSAFPTDRVGAPREYPEPAYVTAANRGTMLLDGTVNRYLRTAAVPVVVDDEPYHLPASLHEYAPYILRQVSRGKRTFNGTVLGLRTDPLPGHPVHLRPASYFDGLCSNELCQFSLTNRATGKTLLVRDDELVDVTGRLVSLAESRLANGVGISTVAFTTDDRLVLVRQSELNIASPRLMAPSGSGSLEPRDHRVQSLQATVAAGMERELMEEVGLAPEDIDGTRILGFGRWLERGARPEFFGLTRLRIDAAEAQRRRPKPRERGYSGRIEVTWVDLPDLAVHLGSGGTVLDWPKCPEVVLHRGSLVLIVTLHLAAVQPA